MKHANSNRLLSGLSNRKKFGAWYLSLIAGLSLNLLLYYWLLGNKNQYQAILEQL